MPQVSKRPISKLLEQKMYDTICDSLVNLHTRRDASLYLQDILTPTEIIMVSKRLAIALLLTRDWDQYAISHYLKVSTTTVQTVKRALNFGRQGYSKVIKAIEKSKEWHEIKTELTQALEEILASRVGANWRRTKSTVSKKYFLKRKLENAL